MRWSVPCLALLIFAAADLSAQVRKFPYQAKITQDETYVRSGPGTRYYPTTRLNRGTAITVHRHDPGGWYMIAPPAGSFSWIRAQYVQSGDGRIGTVTENHVVVRVGTEFGDARDVEQKRLSKGDRVSILGEKSFQTEQGPIRMFKIAPPRGEYRWVPGQFVAPIESIARDQHDRNPYNIPADVKPKVERPEVDDDPFANRDRNVSQNSNNQRPAVIVKPGDAVVRTDRPQATGSEAQQLKQLDDEFRRIVRLQTAEWSFASLEAGYQGLRQSASTPELQAQLDQRFAALAKYQKIKDQYDDFVRLTKETADRDAQLLGMKHGRVPTVVGRPPQPQQQPTPTPSPAAPRQTPPPPTTRPAPSQPRPAARPQQPAIPRRLDGAGIVQRSAINAPGFPAHVLLAPNGRILAYLQSAGNVDLEKYVGRAMGVTGTRTYRTDLKADFIEVESLTPVRLRP